MTRLFLSPRFLLPFMIVFGMAVLSLRITDVWDAAQSGQLFARPALAQTKADAPSAPPAITPPSLATAPASPAPDAAKAAAPGDADAAAASDEDVSPAEMEVLKQLSTRRAELDKRS